MSDVIMLDVSDSEPLSQRVEQLESRMRHAEQVIDPILAISKAIAALYQIGHHSNVSDHWDQNSGLAAENVKLRNEIERIKSAVNGPSKTAQQPSFVQTPHTPFDDVVMLDNHTQQYEPPPIPPNTPQALTKEGEALLKEWSEGDSE